MDSEQHRGYTQRVWENYRALGWFKKIWVTLIVVLGGGYGTLWTIVGVMLFVAPATLTDNNSPQSLALTTLAMGGIALSIVRKVYLSNLHPRQDDMSD